MIQLLDATAAISELVWVVLLVIGFCLVVLEMYIPGFGVPGISGLVCLAVGVYFLANGSLVAGLIMTLVIVALLCVALSISIRAASKGRLARSWLVLKEVSNAPEDRENDLSYYVGKQGMATTILRPAGVGEFEGVRLNVLSDGEFITENEKIVITRIEGNRIFVKKADGNEKI